MVTEDVDPEPWVLTQLSQLDVDDTVSRLVETIEGRGLRVFDVIDHQAAAHDAGLTLRPTRVIVFGSPAAGTPLMVGHPLLALELPLRILVWEGDDHQVRMSHLDGGGLGEWFGLTADEAGVLGGPAMMIVAAGFA